MTGAVYEVIVGNVGAVGVGNNPVRALTVYGTYVRQSKQGMGRVAGEPVALLRNGEIVYEHKGALDDQDS